MKLSKLSPHIIHDTDQISRKMFLELIQPFKVYDQRKKERIASLRKKLTVLQNLFDNSTANDLEEMKKIFDEYKTEMLILRERLNKLKEEKARLILENISLQAERQSGD